MTSASGIRSAIFYYSEFFGSVFVASLAMIAAFMWAYSGKNWRHSLAATGAGICALGVALFPTSGHGCAGAGQFDGAGFLQVLTGYPMDRRPSLWHHRPTPSFASSPLPASTGFPTPCTTGSAGPAVCLPYVVLLLGFCSGVRRSANQGRASDVAQVDPQPALLPLRCGALCGLDRTGGELLWFTSSPSIGRGGTRYGPSAM